MRSLALALCWLVAWSVIPTQQHGELPASRDHDRAALSAAGDAPDVAFARRDAAPSAGAKAPAPTPWVVAPTFEPAAPRERGAWSSTDGAAADAHVDAQRAWRTRAAPARAGP